MHHTMLLEAVCINILTLQIRKWRGIGVKGLPAGKWQSQIANSGQVFNPLVTGL